MAALRKYPDELRERATRLAVELRGDPASKQGADLERLVLAASELRWSLPREGPHHHDRHLAWLLDAGLVEVRLAVFPRIGYPLDPEARTYLESAVWPEHLQSVSDCGHLVGIDDTDREEIQDLLTPGSGRYVLDEPGYHIVHPAILASGRRR